MQALELFRDMYKECRGDDNRKGCIGCKYEELCTVIGDTGIEQVVPYGDWDMPKIEQILTKLSQPGHSPTDITKQSINT